MTQKNTSDPINPSHYKGHPSGVECIDISEYLPFTLGNAVKYVWRAGEKGDKLEQLRKAKWYLLRYTEHKRGCIASTGQYLDIVDKVVQREPEMWKVQFFSRLCGIRHDVEAALQILEVEIARLEGET